MNRRKIDKISDASMIGLKTSFANTAFISRIKGMHDRKMTPAANNLRFFKQVKMPKIIHAYAMEISDIIFPMEKTAGTFSNTLNRYK